ncbi:MAG: ABC transporter ATP-binding protein, partial [Rhodobacteraceae bacterium]|nr:ABC transporter ATP-binding protein [Paracoccaceae bacterium]
MRDAAAQAAAAALAMDRVEVAYRVRGRDRQVLRDVSLAIGPHEAYGLVGESGCGKSTVAFAAMRYLAGNGRVTAGRIEVAGADLAALDRAALRRLRAQAVSMVYQDPAKALNPTLTIGRQLTEACETAGIARADAPAQARAMLERTRIADAERVMRRYPHQLSGGMQQRVCIAMALVARPDLLILDEPTTGLDATIEAEVLDLIAELRREFGAAVLFISHNLAVVARTCDRIGVLYAGMLIEEGATADVFANPRHPYTLALLRCLPQPGGSKRVGRLESIPGRLPPPGAATPPCPFEPRCPLATGICRTETPPWTPAAAHRVRCHHHD